MRSFGRLRGMATMGGCVFALTALTTLPAMASWQYTKWGMSPAAVKAASAGAATDNGDRSLDADGLTAALTAPYQGATLPFKAVFLFDDKDGLKVVTLNPNDRKSCAEIRKILQAHYGPPLSSDELAKAMTARWQDFGNNNVVIFLDLGDGDCSIQYSKLLNTRNDGTL